MAGPSGSVMEDKGPELFGVAVAFLILSWIAVTLRVYVRVWMLKSFGLDDYLIVASQLFMTALVALLIVGINHGIGQHIASGQVTLQDVSTSLKTFYFAELVYIVCTTLLKLSAGFFLLRIVVLKLHKWIIWSAMGATVIFFFNWFFGVMFQCRPPSTFWEVSPLSPKCLGIDAVKGVTYTATALTTLVDLIYGILPMFIIKDLHAPLKHKIILGLILSLAMVACIATIIRIPSIKGLLSFEDFLFRATDVLIWSTVEVGLGIVACCLATLRPLLHLALLRLGLTSVGSSMGAYGKPGAGSRPTLNLRSGHAENYNMNIRSANGLNSTTGKSASATVSHTPLNHNREHRQSFSHGRQISNWQPPTEWDAMDIPLEQTRQTREPSRPLPVLVTPDSRPYSMDSVSTKNQYSPTGPKLSSQLTRYDTSSSEEEIWGLQQRKQDDLELGMPANVHTTSR